MATKAPKPRPSKGKPRKRSNGTGTITRKANGRYAGAVTLGHDANGKQVRKYFTAATRDKAEAIRQRIIRERDAGKGWEAHGTLLGEYLQQWIESHGRNLRPTTRDWYEGMLRKHITPHLGRKRLAELTPVGVEAWVGRLLSGGASPQVARGALKTLRVALRQAVVWQLLPTNPAEHTRLPRVPRKEMTVWTPDEVQHFLAAAAGHRLYALWYLAITTGMRRGELLALHWDDLDLAAGRLEVRRNLTLVKGKRHLGDPKTAAGRRTVLLSPDTVQVLRDHQLNQELELGRRAVMVFASKNGDYLWPRNLKRAFEAVIEWAGVPRIRTHDLRHTATTLLIRHGIPTQIVAERLGHASPSVTLDVYAHIYREQRERAAVSLEDLTRA